MNASHRISKVDSKATAVDGYVFIFIFGKKGRHYWDKCFKHKSIVGDLVGTCLVISDNLCLSKIII